MITATLNGRALYAKGTMYVQMFDPATNDMVYYSNKMSTSQLTSTINLGAINAGPGNPVVIQIPDTPSLTMNLTAADFSLEGRALSAGSNVTYNGTVPVDEVVQADGPTLTVSQTPVYPLGTCDIVGYINNSGTAYLIDPTTREVQGFTATPGQTYCVHYSTTNASAKQFGVDTLMNPAVVRGFITIPVYSTEGNATSTNNGSRVGSLYITIPRGQLSGDVSTEGSQTTPATTIMNLTALSYDEACEAGIQCGTNASPKLAYMVLELYGNPDQNVEELAIVGGNDITVTAGTPYTIPVKYEMDNGEIVTPDLSNFTYTPELGEAFFTVSPTGVITGTADGTATLTIASKFNTDLTTTANVTVEGGGPATPTGNVSFTLTSPTGSGNELTGGGATYTVGVNVVNGTNSVVVTGAKTAAQVIAVTGTNADLVTPGGTGTAPTYTVDTTSIGTTGGAVSFTLNVTEPGYTAISYEVTVTVAEPAPDPDTADVSFALTTPSPGGDNTINGGGANRTVTVNVANATSSVVLTATKTAAQSIAVGGTDQGDVTPGENDTNPTYTVNTTSVQAAGGSKTFTLTVSEASHTSITYNVTVTVAAPDPDTADVTFALTTPPDDSSANTLTGGGSTRTVAVNVANTTASVVITATKTTQQTIEVGGTDMSNVEQAQNETANPTFTVNTTDISTDGGEKTFTLTVSEADHTSIVYNVTVTVAGAGG